jgi:hypothetical protein
MPAPEGTGTATGGAVAPGAALGTETVLVWDALNGDAAGIGGGGSGDGDGVATGGGVGSTGTVVELELQPATNAHDATNAATEAGPKRCLIVVPLELP